MTVKRIRVEPLEAGFSPSRRDWASNVESANEWLSDAYLIAARHYRFDPNGQELASLTDPPMSVMDWTIQRAFGAGDARGHPLVKDAAMPLYAVEHGLPAPPDRNSLSKSERRSADARGEFFVSTGRVWQRGRPVDLDVPLLLYLLFSIEGVIGRRFPQSRPGNEREGELRGKRPPGGPAFRLLQVAYSLASVRNHVMPAGVETIYKVARTARADRFKDKLLRYRLEPWVGVANPALSLPEIVASHPSACAYLFAEASLALRRN